MYIKDSAKNKNCSVVVRRGMKRRRAYSKKKKKEGKGKMYERDGRSAFSPPGDGPWNVYPVSVLVSMSRVTSVAAQTALIQGEGC